MIPAMWEVVGRKIMVQGWTQAKMGDPILKITKSKKGE
jgi:hypothetical protein